MSNKIKEFLPIIAIFVAMYIAAVFFITITGIAVVKSNVLHTLQKNIEESVTSTIQNQDITVSELLKNEFGLIKEARFSKEEPIVLHVEVEPQFLEEPQYYHQAFQVCENLSQNQIYVPTVVFNNQQQADCSLALGRYKQTGSISYGIWALSYKDAEEQILAENAYDKMALAEWDAAIELTKELVDIHPSAPNYYDLGFFYYKRAGQPQTSAYQQLQYLEETEKYYRLSIEKDSNFAPSKASLAYILTMLDLKITPEVDTLFEEAKTLDPGWNFAWMNKALVYSQLGKKQEAYDEAKQAVTTNTRFPDIEYIKQVYLCIGRESKMQEPEEFYKKYGIDKDQPISFCPY